MTSTFPTTPDLQALLLSAGAKPARYGRRWDCPYCGRPGHVSVDPGKGLFHCWHAGCGFKGSAFTLALELGQRFSSGELRAYRDCQRRKETSLAKLKADYRRLATDHRRWLALLAMAETRLVANMDDEAAWSALALAHRESETVSRRLDSLEAEFDKLRTQG